MSDENTDPNRQKRPLADILEGLKKPIPKRLLETKTLKGNQITYVPWYRAQQILDHYTGGYWWYEIREKTITAKHYLVTVRITIVAEGETIYREGTGIESLDTSSFGDFSSNAESMAFRRACARFGLGLQLYDGGN